MGFPAAFKRELLDEVDLVAKLSKLSDSLAKVSPAMRSATLRELLPSLQLAPRLVLPLSSSLVVRGLIVDKCKVMDSAAVCLCYLCVYF